MFELKMDPRLCKDSMAFEKGTIIAEYEDEVKITLKVVGEVAVAYNGVIYTDASQFPDEFKGIIKEFPIEWEQREEVAVFNKNWFEYHLRDGKTIEFIIPNRPLNEMSEEDIEKEMKTIHDNYIKFKKAKEAALCE